MINKDGTAMANTAKNFYALQFHPEVRNSEYGNDILRHFAFDTTGHRSLCVTRPQQQKNRPHQKDQARPYDHRLVL